MSVIGRDIITYTGDNVTASADNAHIDNGLSVLATCGTMTALASLTLIARIYTRGWITHSTNRDDYMMWVAVALSLTGFGVIVAEVLSGGGRYGIYLDPEDLRRSLQLQFISEGLYVWSILFVKISITFCLLRIAPSKVFSRFLWGCMIFFVLIAILYFTALMVKCRPLKMIWDSSIHGTCLDPFVMRAFAYTNNSISLFVDLLLATLPISMIWNVQVALHVKVAIGLVMSMGALAAAACAFRIHYLSPSTMRGDALFDSIISTIWTTVECNIAIVAASVPSIIPLIKKCHELIRAGTVQITAGRNIGGTQDIQQGGKSSRGTEPSTRRKGSMQQSLLVESENHGVKREKIPGIKIEEEGASPQDTDDDDISQMYANASRNITKRSINNSQYSSIRSHGGSRPQG